MSVDPHGRPLHSAVRARRWAARAQWTPSRPAALGLLGASVLAEAAGVVGAVIDPDGLLAAFSFGSVSVLMLAVAVRALPAAVAYGTWAGGSTTLVALIDAAFFRRGPDGALTLGVVALAVGSALLHGGRTARGRRPQRGDADPPSPRRRATETGDHAEG